MAYRRKKYYKKRYYRNRENSRGSDTLAVILLLSFVVVWALSKFNNWYSQLSNSWLFIFWLVFFVIIVIAWRLVFMRWGSRNVESIDIKSVSLHRNIRDIDDDETSDFYGFVDVSNQYGLMQRLRELKPRYFEEFIEMLFRFQDYEIIKSPTYKWTKAQKDGGIDLIVSRDWLDRYIQIKKDYRHQTWVSVIRELSWVIKKKQWMVISASIFSDDAKDFAEEEWIVLVDYNLLLKEIEKISESYKYEIEEFINDEVHIDTGFKYKPKTCPQCFAPLKKRKGFYGCMNYYNTGCDYQEKIS